MSFGTDLGRLPNQRHLGVRLLGAHLQHERHAIANRQRGKALGESLQGFLTAREGVVARKIHRFHVGHVVERQAGGGE